MEGWERIKLIMEQEGYNKNSFSATIGLSNNVTITRLINEERKPSRMTCEKIAQRFPQYNPNWILTGEGDMYQNKGTEIVSSPINKQEKKQEPNTNSSFVSSVHPIENIGFMNVPLVHVRAQCGYLNGYGDQEYVGTLPTLPVIVDRTYHGNYRLFEAEGDSMDDGSRNSICDGDIVLGREVRRDLWQYKLHINDWYFIIVHRTEGISIKKIISHDVEHGIITCHSLNDMFRDYQLHLDEIAELYNLIKIVDRYARL